MWTVVFFLWQWWEPVQAVGQTEPIIIKTTLYNSPQDSDELLVDYDHRLKPTIVDIRPELDQDNTILPNANVLGAVHVNENLILGGHFDPTQQDQLYQKINDPVLNHYGIKEVVSLGVSDFSGSSWSRVQNIKAAMKKFDGIVIPAGEKFSFNQILESVNPEDGFVKEKVVLNGEGTYALGGGVCQLSTTVYRAALNAGLPINERRAHTYAYDKYLPYGLDATIYLGAQDLVFTNDMTTDLLVKPYIDGNKLVVALYGTQDGREVSIKRTNIRSRYSGDLVTGWQRIVKKEEEVLVDDIYSSYKAVY